MKKHFGKILAFAIVGLSLAFVLREIIRNRRLEAEHPRLVGELGEFPVDDPGKFYIRALPTKDPLHFRWRLYFPANYQAQWKGNWTGSSNWFSHNVGSTEPRDTMIQMRFRLKEDGGLAYFYQENMGNGSGSMSDSEMAKFIVDNWNDLAITQTGKSKTQEFDVGQKITLLTIIAPDELIAAKADTLPKKLNKTKSGIFEYSLEPATGGAATVTTKAAPAVSPTPAPPTEEQ